MICNRCFAAGALALTGEVEDDPRSAAAQMFRQAVIVEGAVAAQIRRIEGTRGLVDGRSNR